MKCTGRSVDCLGNVTQAFDCSRCGKKGLCAECLDTRCHAPKLGGAMCAYVPETGPVLELDDRHNVSREDVRKEKKELNKRLESAQLRIAAFLEAIGKIDTILYAMEDMPSSHFGKGVAACRRILERPFKQSE